ncbi:MAG TPA: hypothetical protein VMZ53_22220 [Kofleriaceae bacterium]|nr:hypothetical protein [Kofleriaceae bacterium]
MKMLALLTTIFATATGCHTTSGPTAAAPSSPASLTQPTADLTQPTADLAGRRAQMLAYLHDYTEAGQYPTDDAGLPRSVFVDAKGVRCPMAELIFRSGHADLVDAVAREHNEVRLSDVNEGPLLAWMQSSGLTRDEINLVQGVADLDMVWIQEEAPSQETILARGQIRGRLESAERALRDGTTHSLQVAVAALPNGKLPEAKLAAGAKVVPVAAMKSGPQGRPLRAVALAPRWRTSPQMVVAPNGSITLAPAVRN